MSKKTPSYRSVKKYTNCTGAYLLSKPYFSVPRVVNSPKENLCLWWQKAVCFQSPFKTSTVIKHECIVIFAVPQAHICLW